jgi:hypothetical protein
LVGKGNTFPKKDLTRRRSDAFASPDSDDVVFSVDVTVEADDEAALSAGPVEVEEVGVADIAHLANALNDALPGDDVV